MSRVSIRDLELLRRFEERAERHSDNGMCVIRGCPNEASSGKLCLGNHRDGWYEAHKHGLGTYIDYEIYCQSRDQWTVSYTVMCGDEPLDLGAESPASE